jgi:hypothetical protein
MVLSKTNYFTMLLVLCFITSCEKKDSEVDFDQIAEITNISLLTNQIVDEKINIMANIAKDEVNGSTVEVFIDGQSIYSSAGQENISFEIDPLDYSTGTHNLKIIFIKMDGKTTEKEIEFSVQRKLITINLPENIINQYIINAAVFASKMDGSLLAVQQFTNNDNSITLRTEVDFAPNEEFMLTFALTDNGLATGLLTYANLTLENPRILNLKTPLRMTEGITKTYQVTGFDSTDNFISKSGYQFFDSLYGIYMDTSTGTVSFSLNEGIDNVVDPSSGYYLYGTWNNGFNTDYAYLNLTAPLEDTFVLDKSDFKTDGVEKQSFTISTSQNLAGEPANLHIYGYLNAEDKHPDINRTHLIFNRNQTYSPNNQFIYELNTNLHDYLHSLTYGNYYTERLGVPLTSYSIPEFDVDYILDDNKIQLTLSGTGHDLGRIQLLDYESTSPVYVWNISFNSNSTTEIVIPELPNEVAIMQDLRLNQRLKVGSVELVDYMGISGFEDYLQTIVTNQEDHLLISTGYDVISKSENPFFNRPIKDYIFQ